MKSLIDQQIAKKRKRIKNCTYNPGSASIFPCGELSCKYCYPNIIKYKRYAIQARIEDNKLFNMITLTTTSQEPREARRLLKKLQKDLNVMITADKQHLEKLYSFERYSIWLHMPYQQGPMVNRTFYCDRLIEAMQNHQLYDFLKAFDPSISKNICTRATSNYFNEFKGYNRRELHDNKLKLRFYKAHDEYFKIIFNYLYDSDISFKNSLDKEVDERFVSLFDTRFAHISCIELSRQKYCHIHAAINKYVPYMYRENIFHQGYFNKRENYHNDWRCVESIAAYLTKDCHKQLEFMEHLSSVYKASNTEAEDQVMINPIRSSKFINLKLEEYKYNKPKLKKVKYNRNPNIHYNNLKPLYNKLQSLYDSVAYEYKRNKKKHKQIEEQIIELEKQINQELLIFITEEIERLKVFSLKLQSENREQIISNPSHEQTEFIEKVYNGPNIQALSASGGTGKSLCIAEVINKLDFVDPNHNPKVLLCALMGKAVQRTVELIKQYCPDRINDIEIKTIHKAMLSRYSSYNPMPMFCYHEGNRSDYDLVIVDEAGTADLLLCALLLNGLKDNCKVIFVGDTKQLPPVNGVSILSKTDELTIDTLRLTINYRFDDKIKHLAESFYDAYKGDIFTLVNDDYKEIINLITREKYTSICNDNRLVDLINRTITASYPIKGYRGYRYQIGMPVMFLRNDDRGIMNGQIEYIRGYDPDKKIFEFDNGIKITRDESLYMFVPAYAITCHKSQGSEFDKVIVLLDNQNKLLTPQLAYTAVTRTKKKVMLFKVNGVNEKLLYYKCS